LRVRTLSAVFASFAVVATSAAPAMASGTGGVAAVTSPAHRVATALVVPPHAAPVTARSASITYTGPVYQRTATGEVIPYQATAPATQGGASPTGGSPVGTAAPVQPQLLVPGSRARYVGGQAAAPMSAPAVVQQIIWAGDQIIGLPYIFGGGHASFVSSGYDCSGLL
jgi:cell wall-associated NlpC family hydrolase